MKPTCFVLICMIFLPRACSAQDRDDSSMMYPDTIPVIHKRIGSPGKEDLLPGKLGFSGARFIDHRIDTSCFGYDYSLSGFSKIDFRKGLAVEFDRYVNIALSNGFSAGKDSLLVIVDRFRVSPTGIFLPAGDGIRLVSIKMRFAERSQDRGFLVGDYDTLLVYKAKRDREDPMACIRQCLKSALQKADLLAPLADKDSEKFSASAFSGESAKSKQIPILGDSLLKRGVYTSFEEVVMNSPKYAHYEPTRGKANSYDINVIDSSGKAPSANFWGYCDGKTIFVYSPFAPEHFYPLIREDNSLTISLKNADPGAAKAAARGANGVLLAVAVLSKGAVSGSPVGYEVNPPRLVEKIGKKKYGILGAGINLQTGLIDF